MGRLAPYLPIGQILKPHGIKGEMKVRPMTDDPERYFALKSIFLKEGEQYAARRVTGVRVQGGSAYVAIEGVSNRNAAEKMRDAYLYINRAHAAKLPKGRYFICDLIGCIVRDETGKEYGVVREIIQTGANDVYVVGEDEWMLPVLKNIIASCDVEQGVITVHSAALPEVDPDEY